MDTTLTKENRKRLSPYLCFVILAAVTAVCIAVGMKYTSAGEASFYGRYDGITSGFLTHVTTAVVCSASTLVELMILYFMSYSPLLLPAGMTVIGCRGFIAGTAYSMGGNASLLHIAMYTAATAVICTLVAVLWHFGKSHAVLKKTAALLTFAGVCVILEIILSYIA